MGNFCTQEAHQFTKIVYTLPYSPSNVAPKKSKSLSTRFGEIQKLKTKRENTYRLIMSINDEHMQTVSLDCRVMDSVADFQLYDGCKITIEDHLLSPIVDIFDQEDNQIYHHIRTAKGHLATMKIYKFESWRDSVLKNGLYQITMYQSLKNSQLQDYFIMSRGKISALVMIFKYYEVSLLDIIHYRKLDNFYYTEQEILFIAKIVVDHYKNLRVHGIFHRDLRLSKIFFTPQNKMIPYEFANLESARKYQQKQNQEDMITVKGVNLFAAEPIKTKIQKDQQIAHYKLEEYDLKCLGKIILSLTSLDVFGGEKTTNNLNINKLVERCFGDGCTIDNLQGTLREITRQNSEAPTIQYDRDISLHLMKEQLKEVLKERIESAQLKAHFLLHQKQNFQKLLFEEMTANDKAQASEKNIDILHQLGHYYQQIGFTDNDYYREQIKLLLQLAEKERNQAQMEGHHEYIQQVAKIEQEAQIFRADGKNESEKNDQNELRMVYLREIAYDSLYYEDNKKGALGQIKDAMEVSSKWNCSIKQQLKLIEAEGLIKLQMGEVYEAEEVFDKGLLIAEDPNNFETTHSHLLYLATFKYLNAQVLIQLMDQEKSELRLKNIARAKNHLTTAISTLKNLPLNTANIFKIINCFLLQSTLDMKTEEYHESTRSLESVDTLIREIEKEKTETVSKSLKLEVLERLKTSYEKEGNKDGFARVTNSIKLLNEKVEESNLDRLSRKRIKSSIFKKENDRKENINKKSIRLESSNIIVEANGEEEDEKD